MALTREIIVANAALAGLTDDQIKALENLSKNDENTVIGKRIGEIYKEMDTKIEEITGVKRDGDEKTYNYLARAAAGIKESLKDLEPLKKQVDDLTKEKARLDKLVAEGATDAETKKQLDQAKADLTAITKQYNDLKTNHDKAVTEHQQQLFGVQVENQLSVAAKDIKFKADLPAGVTTVILDQALGKIKGLNPEFIDDGKGGKMLVFKDETGAVMRNPEAQLNPYTAQDLLHKELKTLGVLDEGRKQQGAGTGGNGSGNGGGGNGSGGVTIDISQAKTRVEANEAITNQLLQNGLVNGSDEFQAALTQAWTDNNVASLPEQ